MKCIFPVLLAVLQAYCVFSQNKTTPSPPGDSILITIFLKHQQDKNLDSLNRIQEHNQFLKKFPPASARVVSRYVMMGVGQVVTVKIPASELRNLNRSIEQAAWGAFNTEFYPTYDFVPLWKAAVEKSAINK